MQKIENWESIEAKQFGEREQLKLGGHVCKITKAEEYTSPFSNTTSLKIEVDIAEGEQKDFFKKQFEADTRKDKKYPNAAIKYVSLKEEHRPMLKGFITCIENSNPGFKFDFDESKLVDKKVVGVFGLEEYENDKKEIKTATKLTGFRSLDKLKEVKIPKVKILTGTLIDYNEYINTNKALNTKSVETDPFASVIEYTDNAEIEL